MLGAERDRPFQRRQPLCARLAGDAEDEVEVDVLAAGLAQDFIRTPRLLRGVHTTESQQERRLPALHAHRNPIDAEREQSARFFERDGRRIHLQCPFFEDREIKARAQAAEQVFELCGRERAGRAAAEEDRPWTQHPPAFFRREPGRLRIQLCEHSVEKRAGFVAVARLFVERAIRTHLWAKRNVHVKVLDRRGRGRNHWEKRNGGFRCRRQNFGL